MYGLFVQVFKTEYIDDASFPQLVEIARSKEELKSMKDINIALAKRNGDSIIQTQDNEEKFSVSEVEIDSERTAINVIYHDDYKDQDQVIWATKIFIMEI